MKSESGGSVFLNPHLYVCTNLLIIATNSKDQQLIWVLLVVNCKTNYNDHIN